MNNHPDLDSMIKYIYESIKRDCERHIMYNRISLGLPPTNEILGTDVPSIDFKASIIDEDKIKGFKSDSIFDWTKNFIFPTVRHEKSWFWLKMLMMERYYAEQKRILLTDMSNYDKPDIDGVIWWNLSLILYAVKRIKEEKLDEISYDSIPYVDVIVRKMILDIDPWRDALRHFKMNYTEDLKISKWHRIYVTKEMCPSMSDDEINYMNHIWNDLFDQPYMPDFNNNNQKNSWLERKTKRGK